jgi:cbb3-type cytochrome oxidase maturation protein
MKALGWLVPVALFLGGLGLVGFFWSLKRNQFEDLEGASWRALDDEPPHDGRPGASPSNGIGGRP